MRRYLILLLSSWCLSQATSFVQIPQHRTFLIDRDRLQFSTPACIPETSPLSPLTFAGMVEKAVIEKFGEEEISRVLESWRLLDQEYEHREYVGPANVSPEDSECHQHAHSFVPGLPAKEFWDVSDFSWPATLSSRYKSIREEFLRVTGNPSKLQEEGNNIWAGALTDEASGYGTGWKTLVLMDRGFWDPVNVNLFPKAAKAVHDSGIPVTEVFFASMKPNSSIKPHSDFTNFVLTSHLALDIPESGNNKCRLTIGDKTRQWINGEVMLFDTSIRHSAANDSDEMRYILMMRLWHPDLTSVERDALQFTFDCLQVPELVSEDSGERFLAERKVEALHAFPEIRGKASSVGFGAVGTKRKQKQKKARPAARGFGSK